jgi:hypothetical protein
MRRRHGSLRPTELVAVAVITAVVFAGIGAMIHNLSGPHYGYDFRGILAAARAMTHGHDPYVGATRRALLLTNNPYVLPPLVGELTIPLTAMPYWLAVGIFNLVCGVAMLWCLWLLGVRDLGVYLIAMFSLPFIDSLWLGQPDGVFALALAVAWRYRERWPAAVAVAFLIAAKLLLWPLVVWLLVTRRIRMAVLSAALAVALLAASWGAIGFAGLSGYEHRLSLDAQAFSVRSHSFAGAAIRLGSSFGAADVIGLVVALALTAVVVWMSRGSAAAEPADPRGGLGDLGLFTAATVFALFSSPLLWTHYLLLLFVPLAIARRRLGLAWLLSAGYYISPVEPPAHVWQTLLVPAVGFALAALTVGLSAVPRSRFRPRARTG